MFERDDPAHLLGQDPESVVARIADAAVRGDALQLAETRMLFALVSRRAAALLPPTTGRFTASLVLGPVAALARTVDDIDVALTAVFDWLVGKPSFVLQALGRRLEDAEQAAETAGPDAEPALLDRLGQATRQASVPLRMGCTDCLVAACGDELQIRLRDPDTGRYLTLGHLPFDPDEDRQDAGPEPQLAA